MTIRFWKLEILKKEIKWVLHVLEFPNDAIFFLQIQMERGTLNLWVLIIKGGEFGIFIS